MPSPSIHSLPFWVQNVSKSTAFLLILLCLGFNCAFSQVADTVLTADSLVVKDSVSTSDSLQVEVQDSTVLSDSTRVARADSIPVKYGDDDITDILKYSAQDSIVYDLSTNKVYLYENAQADYQDITLKSALVQFDYDVSVLSAQGVYSDSAGKMVGQPVFKQADNEYDAQSMTYNFKTERGKIQEAYTQEGEGYLLGEQVKKAEDGSFFVKGARYTTCTAPEPHFHIYARKARMVPGKVMVTGPANLQIAGIPTPLAVPFAIYPLDAQRENGIIIPEFGGFNGGGQGLFLRDGGYYFKIKDYVGVKLTGDIFSQGTYSLRAGIGYKVRYKFDGSLNFQYTYNPPIDRDVPDAAGRNNYSLNWSFRQDPKAKPYSSFNANVNYETANFRSNTFINNQALEETNIYSNINYLRRFKNAPLNFSISGSHRQDIQDHTVDINAPEFRLNLTQVNPFKPKEIKGKKKWYEGIGIRGDLATKAQTRTVDSLLFRQETLDNAIYGGRLNLIPSVNFNLGQAFTVQPSFNYTERYYFERVEKSWDPTVIFPTFVDDSCIANCDTVLGRVITDTMNGFYRIPSYTAAINLSTNLFGIFNFRTKRLKAIRHVFSPSIGYSYKPDYGSPDQGIYSEVQSDTAGNTQSYSHFENVQSLYGLPGRELQQRLTFGISNRFEMKLRSNSDTTNETRKVSLIDNLSITSSYDFARDSLKLGNFVMNLSTRLPGNTNIRLNATFSPYTYNELNRPINTFVVESDSRLLRLISATASIGGSINSRKSAANKQIVKDSTGVQESEAEYDYMMNHPDAYYDFDIPWDITYNYAVNINRQRNAFGDTLIVRQTATVSTNFNVTPNWKIDLRTGYDITNKAFTVTTFRVLRDLHCWQLSFDWTAFPRTRQQFSIQVNAKSALLQELKLSRRRNYLSPIF